MNNKSFLAIAVAIGLALGACPVVAQNAGKPRAPDPVQKPAPAAANPKEQDAEKFLSQAAQNLGVRTCRPMADKVNRYLIGDSQSWGMLYASPENPNTRIVSSVIEIQTQQGSTTYVSASYAPNGDMACGVAYDAVTYWNESCADVSSKVLKDLRPIGTLGNKIVMLDGGPAMRMFLMPAGSGCVQIKKEVIY